MTCALRCIISAYCIYLEIYHSLDKHFFECKIVNFFLHIRFNLLFGAYKNRLMETVL